MNTKKKSEQKGWGLYIHLVKFLIFLIILNSCNGQNSFSMDSNLINHVVNKVNLHEEDKIELDSLLEEYPCNDLLISVKAFDLINNLLKDEALQLLDTCQEANPTLSESTFFNWIKGFIAIVEGDFQKSIDFFHQSYLFDKANINPWVRLELYNYYYYNEPAKAIEYLNESLDISENFIDGWLAMGSELERNKDYEAALTLYQSLLKKKELPYIYNAIGALYLKSEKINKAKEAFKKSIEIKETADGFIGIGDINFYLENYQRSLKFYKKALKTKDCYHIVYSRIAITNVRLNNLLDARLYFEKAFNDFPSEYTISDIVYVHILLGEIEQADSYLERMIAEYGRSSKSIFWELLILGIQGKIAEGQNKVDELFENYTTPEINWIKQELSVWGIDIISKDDR